MGNSINGAIVKPRLAVVVTTIGRGDFLDKYCSHASDQGWKGDIRIIVIPDKKSPPELYEKCQAFRTSGFDVVCPTLAEQESICARFGNLSDLIPYNSDNRRNIGFLMALEWGCDVLVSLDDDNYFLEGSNFFDEHAVACGSRVKLPTIQSSDGWFNACEMLEFQPNYPVYARGFPYHKRHQTHNLTYTQEEGLVRLNTGLWLSEPDVDAMTWLTAPTQAISFKGQPVLLGQDVWSPINTQNTALHRDLIFTYYFIRMGYRLEGMLIDRYGDIFSGYFCEACVQHMGDRIRIGTPLVFHRRNAHNYLQDLSRELACILVLEDLTEWLRELKLQGDTYADTYLSLADALDHQVERFRGSIWTDSTKGYFHQVTYCMRQWVRACRLVGG